MATSPQRGWLLAAACLSFTSVASAQFDPASPLMRHDPSHAEPLPFFDARLDAEGLPVESVRAAIAAARDVEVLAARDAEAARLRAEIAGLRIDDHELFATPVWVASTLRLLTGPIADQAFDARVVVRTFLGRHPALFEIDAAELDTARLARNFLTKHNGVRHLTFQQQIEGIDLFGCEVKANVTREGALVNVSSSMLPRPAGGFSVPAVVVDPRDALYLAAADIGALVSTEFTPLTEPAGSTRRQVWAPTADFRADTPITTELVHFARTRADVRPAWSLVLPEKGLGNTYEMIVDATNGEVLRRWNRLHFLGGTQPITMRVYTTDSPAPMSPGLSTPSNAQAPFVPRQLVTVHPGDVASASPNHWINDGANETLGNNVDAHTDLDADNNPDLPRPQGVPFRTFDFALDTNQAPSTYRAAAVTQLFYLANVYHDRTYDLGFDEVAANFQQDNFGLGGVGGDRIQADAQDGSGTNNANFSFTSADGDSGCRMQMYVFTGPTPDRDGDLDADIVFHELSHGLSQRLHGGLSGTQPGGMGEGWGDFFGVALNAEPGDDLNGTYHTGGYSTQNFFGLVENYYFGIRRFPYSTDFNKNPQTYEDIDPALQDYPPSVPRSTIIGNTANQVHNVGEVWCNTLLEARAGLCTVYGFAGNELIMQLAIDGMKLSPSNPTFLQARDGILQSNLVNNGGVDLGTLWTAFAKRGMGISATSPGSSTSSGIVEAYDVPSLVLFTYPSGAPTQLQPGAPTTFEVAVQGLAAVQPISGTGFLHYSVNGGAFNQVAMTATGTNEYDATLPAGSCLDEVRYYVSTNTTGGVETDPVGAPASTRTAVVFSGLVDVFTDDFETNQSWVATATAGVTSGAWQRGVPVNASDWEYDPISDSDGSGQCYVTQNASGNTDVDGGAVTLTSPTIDMTAGAVRIRYDYYLNLTISDGTDRLLVEANSSNGAGAWIAIASHTTSGGTSWRSHQIDSSALAAAGVTLTSTMKVRFTANDTGTASVTEAGVDAFRVEALVCDGVGLAYCFGDGTTATGCPCGNVGLAGHGCENSDSTGGALLGASGTTSPDTVLLSASGEYSVAATIFLQGNVNIASGVGFGDGVRCVGGTLKRIALETAVGGSASYPGVGDPSISAQSAALGDPIAPGSTRYYQAYYRDPNLAFCPAPAGDSWNVTNGVSIVW